MASFDGDNTRESEMYVRFGPVARAYFARHGRGPDAEDLAHEAVLKAIEALRAGHVREPSRIGGFLLGICRNLVRDGARKDARGERALALASVIDTAAAAPAPAPRVDAYKLWQCVNALNARARAVVLRTWVEDDDAEAIARAHATTPGNVRVMRHRALAALLACLEGGAR